MFGQIDDRTDNLAAFIVSKHDRAEHFFLGQLFGFTFNHHHSVLRRCNNQIETAIFAKRIINLGVQDVFAIGRETNASSADWAHERQTRNGQRSRGCNHCNDIGLCLAIIGQDLADNVDLIVKAFGEKRTTRAVNKPRCQRLFFRRAAFALEKAAGNAPSSREFFLIVNG